MIIEFSLMLFSASILLFIYLYKLIIETREMIIDLRKDHGKLIEIVINTIKGEVDANNRK